MLSELGYYRPTYDEIVEDKEELARQLFGEDIDTSELTPLGKFIRISANVLSKAYEDLEATYYARFPNTASGISLDRLCVFAGITRNPPTQAQHTVRVYSIAESETELGIGELVVCAEDNEITFYSANNFVLPLSGGYVDVVVECADAGEIGNVPIVDIVNPIAEVDRIEYIGLVKAGEEAESDYDLRKRFTEALAGSGSANANSIKSALLRIPTVISASVIENETDVADEKGRPPRSFECFVYGGEEYEQEIAEAIFDKKPIGIKTCSTSDNPIAITVLDDGGYEHVINFSHTENIDIYINIKYKRNASFEEDGEIQIKNKIVEYINGLGANTDVILSSLYGYIYSVSGVTDVSSIELSTDGDLFTSTNVTINEWQVANTLADKIVLEVVE